MMREQGHARCLVRVGGIDGDDEPDFPVAVFVEKLEERVGERRNRALELRDGGEDALGQGELQFLIAKTWLLS